jgi:hypothetical protein
MNEERGCLDDLLKLLDLSGKEPRPSTDGNGMTSVSPDDRCQKLGSSTNGMSLCRCTSHLCNTSSAHRHCLWPIVVVLFYAVERRH